MIATLSLALAIAVPMQVKVSPDARPRRPDLRAHAAQLPTPASVGESDRSGTFESLREAHPLAKSIGVRPAVQQDEWFGNDKLRHFFLSMAVTQFTYGGLRTVSADDDVALPIAIGVAAAGGVGKEVRDAQAGGPFSLKDLVWDAAGITVAAFLLGAVR